MRAILAVLVTVPGLAMAQVDQGAPNADFAPAFENQTRAPALPVSAVSAGWMVQGLENPWGIAVLPGEGYLVTERAGRLRYVTNSGGIETVSGLPEVRDRRQGGLLDVAVRGDFASTRQVWWTYAKPVGRGTATAAATGTLSADGTRMENVRDIFVQEPAEQSGFHFGSRIVFGDGGLWVTTGDRGVEQLAQGDNTIGKVVWVPDGGQPEVWSSGHRNMQGATIRNGRLWTIEHGPRGGDELNQPERGRNYGWPVISYGINYSGSDVGQGIAVAEGYEQPVYYWDPVIAPGGMAFHNGVGFDWGGDLLIGSLNPGGLVRLRMQGDRVVGEERLLSEWGRVRDVEVLGDGSVLLLIDAPDGGVVRVTPG